MFAGATQCIACVHVTSASTCRLHVHAHNSVSQRSKCVHAPVLQVSRLSKHACSSITIHWTCTCVRCHKYSTLQHSSLKLLPSRTAKVLCIDAAAETPAPTPVPAPTSPLFDLKSTAGAGPCKDLYDTMALDPDLSNWTSLLRVGHHPRCLVASHVRCALHRVTIDDGWQNLLVDTHMTMTQSMPFWHPQRHARCGRCDALQHVILAADKPCM